jgi:hypothetical protein
MKDSTKAEPIPGEDFYLENQFMVFTAKWHLKRGYCCGSGCRHCPYGPADKSSGPKAKEQTGVSGNNSRFKLKR